MYSSSVTHIKPNVIDYYNKKSEKAGLKREDTNIKCSVSQNEIVEIFARKNYLIKVAEPFLYELYHFVENTGFFLELLDENGVILHMVGDDAIVEMAESYGMKTGADMSIESAGTNAISVCLGEDLPCQLEGSDHFLFIFNKFTCSCASIHDQNEKIIGFVNLNGYSENVHKHTLGLVVAAVNSIKNHLLYESSLQKIDIANRVTNSVIESINLGIVTTDKRGKIVFINSFATKFLKDSMAIGYYIYDYFVGNQFKQNIIDSKELENEHFLLKSSNMEMVIDSHYIINIDGSSNGYVMIIKTVDDIIHIANKYSNLQANYYFKDMVCEDSIMRNIIRYSKKIANSPSAILITGENGVGKTMLAEAIHNESNKSKMPFVEVNCEIKTEEELLYDLFGNNKNIDERKSKYLGKLNSFFSGTILIEGVNYMSLAVQKKLLNYIKSTKSNNSIIKTRIISTTSIDLKREVEIGNFNIELFYELSVIPINIPPLRERQADVKALIAYYLKVISNRHKKKLVQPKQEVLDVLYSYNYGGNITELEKIVERIVSLNGELEFDLTLKENQYTEKEIINFKIEQLTIDKIEEIAIKNCLKNNNYNYKLSAKKLGISRTTLYNKLKKINKKDSV
ncbi:sigma-54-dependent Fis family transcriptional regulator [Clostridium sp. DL1XJH146]